MWWLRVVRWFSGVDSVVWVLGALMIVLGLLSWGYMARGTTIERQKVEIGALENRLSVCKETLREEVAKSAHLRGYYEAQKKRWEKFMEELPAPPDTDRTYVPDTPLWMREEGPATEDRPISSGREAPES